MRHRWFWRENYSNENDVTHATFANFKTVENLSSIKKKSREILHVEKFTTFEIIFSFQGL